MEILFPAQATRMKLQSATIPCEMNTGNTIVNVYNF